VLSCVLAYAAVGKLGRLAEFADQIAAYRLLPAGVCRPTAALVIGAELTAAALLLPPTSRPVGALLAAGLFGAFVLAQASAAVRGCGSTAAVSAPATSCPRSVR
jgi:hypothetical protein